MDEGEETMIRNLIRVAVVALLLLTIRVNAQSPLDMFTPLKSNRADVVREFGTPGKRSETGQLIYETREGDIRFIFYKSGCSSEVEKALRLTRDTLLEVGLDYRPTVKFVDAFGDGSSFESFPGHGGDKLYYASGEGRVVTTTIEDGIEMIKANYRIPSKLDLKECLFQSFDNNSAIAELHFFGILKSEGDRFKFPPIQVGRFFEGEDLERTKSKILVEFAKTLSRHPDGVGYVTIMATAGDSPAIRKERESTLLDKLRKLGIDCTRIVFVNGGEAPFAGASFTVVHKSFLDEGGWKPEC